MREPPLFDVVRPKLVTWQGSEDFSGGRMINSELANLGSFHDATTLDVRSLGISIVRDD